MRCSVAMVMKPSKQKANLILLDGVCANLSGADKLIGGAQAK